MALAGRFALGFVWILDGLEVTIVGAIGPTAAATSRRTAAAAPDQ
jgi:hypothetical protein